MEEFQQLILKIDEENTPQALSGKTCVYLPSSHADIVLKATGSEVAKKRLAKIRQAQQVVEKLQIRCLVIPETVQCGEFLIAKRLPIPSDFHQSMALYHSEPELFDEAVREAIQFFRECDLPFLIARNPHPFNFPEIGNYVKYDNIPLYITTESDGRRVGKIGLIDVERLTDQPSNQALEVLARIFPYHLSVIIEEASQLGIAFDRDSLEKAKQKGELFLQFSYINPYNQYGSQSGLDLETMRFPAQNIENQVIERGKRHLQRFIQKTFPGNHSALFEQSLEEAANTIFAGVLEAVNQSMKMANVNKVKLFKEGGDSEYPFIPMTTSVIKCREGLNDKLSMVVWQLQASQGEFMVNLSLFEKFPIQWTDLVLKHLVKEGVLLGSKGTQYRNRSKGGLHTAFWIHFDVYAE